MVRLMLVLALVLSLAACGGSRTDGLSKTEEQDLETRLEAAEAARAQAEVEKARAEDARAQAEALRAEAEAAAAEAEAARAEAEAARAQAEVEKAQAEADKAKAEADKARAEAEVQHQLREALRARQEAETARQEAETARGEAETARGEADTARGETAAAEREQERLAEEAEEARQQALQAEASVALAGLGSEVLSLPAMAVTPKYNAPADVRPTDVTFTSPQGSSAGRWYATTAHNRGQTYEDTIVVYSDVGSSKSTPIMEVHRDFEQDPDTASLYRLSISNDNEDRKVHIASSQFPTTGGARKDFALTVDSDADTDNDLTAQIRGSYDGASGNYRCSNTGVPCTVEYTGAGYLFKVGTWTFRTSKGSTVRVPDADFMNFGWWRRKTNETGAFSYGSFSGTSNTGDAQVDSDFNALEGTARYVGRAIGQYAIYQRLGTQSNHGEFKATATLDANFGNRTAGGTLSGSITGFDVSPGWSLTFNAAEMSNGLLTSPGDVSWTIDGNTEDGGTWTGQFHSEGAYDGQDPDGLIGEFNAEYDDVGKIRGAYGAHKQ